MEGGTIEKLHFIKDYKFVISFENSSHEGYTTEKILEPLLANCIPIYWGDPKVNLDFNKNRFLNYTDFRNEKEFINKILEVDNDDLKAFEILRVKCFTNENKSIEEFVQILSEFLLSSIGERNLIIPKSTIQFYVILNRINLIYKKIKRKINRINHNYFFKKRCA